MRLNNFFIRISLLLISIFGCDNNIWQISIYPWWEAKNNAVQWNDKNEYHEQLWIEIAWFLQVGNGMNNYHIKIFVQLILMPGCNNKSWTISI